MNEQTPVDKFISSSWVQLLHIMLFYVLNNWPLCSYDLLLQVNLRWSTIRTGAQKDSALLKMISVEQKKQNLCRTKWEWINNLAEIWAVVFKSIQKCRKKCWQMSHEVFLWQTIHKMQIRTKIISNMRYGKDKVVVRLTQLITWIKVKQWVVHMLLYLTTSSIHEYTNARLRLAVQL
jgi:hypothetical protein